MKHDTDILKRIKTYFMRRKSAGEAHAFEREIEKDPFLYEAMEGLEGMLTSDLQQALDELDYRLDDKVKVNPWMVNWKLAASVLLFIGVGATIYFLIPDSTSENNVVLEEKSNSYDPRSSKREFDSVEYMDTTMAVAAADSFTTTIVLEDAIVGNNMEPISQMPEVEKPTAPTEEVANLFKNDEAEVALAEEADEEAFDNLVLDSSEDSEAELSILEDYAMTTNAPISSQEISEAVSVKVESKSARSKNEEAQEIVSTPPQPINGMASYQAYLKKNLRKTEGMPVGAVVISFEIDRNGRPKKPKVTKSLCTACDAEAMRLIQSGPKWQTSDKNAKVTVNVKFE